MKTTKKSTIRKKIALPFITLNIIIPMLTIILFNISMKVYVNQFAKNELLNTISGIETLVNQQIKRGFLHRTPEARNENAKNNLSMLRSSLRVSNLTSNTEFLIISAENELIFPDDFSDSFLDDDIYKEAISQLANKNEKELIEFNSGGKTYFAIDKNLFGRLSGVKLLFISSGNPANDTIYVINLSLISISILAAMIGIAIILRTSKSISEPVTRLSDYAKRIGMGEFLTMPEENSSQEIYELTDSMNEMSERLRSYDNAQKSFLQNASHELRTPLMSIQGYAEGIAKEIFKDPVSTANIICEESKRLNTLVEELLTLSRIENQTYQGEVIQMNLSDIVKEYIQKIEGYAIKEGKNLVLDIKEDILFVEINDTLLLQAVINVISNCVKFAKDIVKITVYSDNSQAVIQISDDGNGISEIDLPHIFDRFYKGKKGNFGLGLAIAKSAVESMGGTITAFNGDTGAVFEIKLPFA